VIIFKIEVENFAFRLVDPERDPPIAGDGEAPGSSPARGEPMSLPRRKCPKFFNVLHILKEGENVANFLDVSGGKT
jgi:hypothetical protein